MLTEATDVDAWVSHARAAVAHQIAMSSFNRTRRAVLDYAAAHALEYFFCGRVGGIALELGGLDGVLWSETRVLEQAMDMRRVVIDGNPAHRPRRLKLAADAIGVEAAVCNRSSVLHFVVSGPTSGLAELMPDEELRKVFPSVHRAREDVGGNWGRVDWSHIHLRSKPLRVVCLPLRAILNYIGLSHINLFVLDVEGSELDVLRTIDWSRIHFDLMVIEATLDGMRPAGYASEVLSYIRSASRGNYVAASGKRNGEVRGRDIWLRHRNFKPSACAGLFDDAPLSIARAGFAPAPI